MSDTIDTKSVEERTYDITTPELVAAIGLRHNVAVLVTSQPNAQVPGAMPLSIMVIGKGLKDNAGKLAALRLARTAIDFLVVQIENGPQG